VIHDLALPLMAILLGYGGSLDIKVTFHQVGQLWALETNAWILFLFICSGGVKGSILWGFLRGVRLFCQFDQNGYKLL